MVCSDVEVAADVVVGRKDHGRGPDAAATQAGDLGDPVPAGQRDHAGNRVLNRFVGHVGRNHREAVAELQAGGREEVVGHNAKPALLEPGDGLFARALDELGTHQRPWTAERRLRIEANHQDVVLAGDRVAFLAAGNVAGQAGLFDGQGDALLGQ